MNKQTHCGETVRNNTDLDFDLAATQWPRKKMTTCTKMKPVQTWEVHYGLSVQNKAGFIGLALCGAKSTAFWLTLTPRFNLASPVNTLETSLSSSAPPARTHFCPPNRSLRGVSRHPRAFSLLPAERGLRLASLLRRVEKCPPSIITVDLSGKPYRWISRNCENCDKPEL